MRSLPLLLLLLGPACGTGPSETPDELGGKIDLPNSMLFERDHDGGGYRKIAEQFEAEGFDLSVDLEKLAPAWPMQESGTALLDRFGTPVQLKDFGYFHTAVDIIRRNVDESDIITAPVSGLARVFDWSGRPGFQGRAYAGVVAILDSESHVIVQLMHVMPSQYLLDATTFIEVEKGDVVGTLADDLDFLEDDNQQLLRHTHVGLIDGEHLEALNPLHYFDYHDDEAPTVNGLYVLSETSQKFTELRSGELDVVLEVFDRDTDSDRNFEVARIGYQILDQDQTVLRESAPCEFAHLYNSIEAPYKLRALDLIDFGGARRQYGIGGWPNSDLANRDRTFRYALTQLKVSPEGRCDIYADDDAFVEIPDEVSSIEIRAEIWDPSGNKTEFAQVLQR